MLDLIAFSAETTAIGQNWIHCTGLGKHMLVCLPPLNPRTYESLEDIPRCWINGCCVQKGTEIFPPRNHSWRPFHWSWLLRTTSDTSLNATAWKAQVRPLQVLRHFIKEILDCCLLIFQVKKLQRLGQHYDGTPWYS